MEVEIGEELSGSSNGQAATGQAAGAVAGTQAPGPVASGPVMADRREGREPGPDRRLDRVDRRVGLDRRQKTVAESGYTGPERRVGEDRRTGLERRRGPGRRRSDDRKAAEEGEMTAHQFEFVMAIQTYKRVNKRLYPTWTEILEIMNQLGYRKVLKRKIKLEAPEAELFEQ